MSKELLLTYFDKIIPLTSIERSDISQYFKEKKVKKKEIILHQNKVCDHYTFVAKGLLKMYAIDEQATAHNLQFASENDWIMDISSFHTNKPSQLNIEALENSTLLQLDKPGLVALFSKYKKLNIDFRVIIENQYITLQNRMLSHLSTNAEEKYLQFISEHRQLANRLPNTQIASYLGITPEFLSKIRNKLAQQR